MNSSVAAVDLQAIWREVGEDVVAATRRVGSSGRWLLGPELEAFEAELAEVWPCRAVVGCGSGLGALEIALRALDLPLGSAVLSTPVSAFATTLAILRAGLRPVFSDVDDSGLLDLDLAETVLASRSDISCLLPVHLYGHALDLDRLENLGRRFEIPVLEDCAQAIGADFRGRAVGSVSRLAATSFYPTKNLGTLGDGGAVLVEDLELEAHVRRLRDYGRSSTWSHTELGLNSRLDELHAAILRSAMLPRLSAWTAARRGHAKALISGLDGLPIRPILGAEGSGSVWHLFAVRVAAERREAFREHLSRRGIGSGLHYPLLIPDQPAMAGVDFEVATSLDRAALLVEEEVSLPLHPHLDSSQIEAVLDACRAFCA